MIIPDYIESYRWLSKEGYVWVRCKHGGGGGECNSFPDDCDRCFQRPLKPLTDIELKRSGDVIMVYYKGTKRFEGKSLIDILKALGAKGDQL